MYTITSERKGTYALIRFYRSGKSGIYRTIKVPHIGGEIEGNFKDILHTDPIVIKGHYTLTLNVGEHYHINYGIHNGKYKYIGRVIEVHKYKDSEDIITEGPHTFCKVGEEDNLFMYYGKYSPFEMTRIIQEYE